MTRKLPLTIACNDYDRTRPIKDGRVPVEGCEVNYLTYEAEEMFFRALRFDEFDVAELSFSGYLMTVARDNARYIAIPAFVSRFFRHSAALIRTDRGLPIPADLKGRTVGLPDYPRDRHPQEPRGAAPLAARQPVQGVPPGEIDRAEGAGGARLAAHLAALGRRRNGRGERLDGCGLLALRCLRERPRD